MAKGKNCPMCGYYMYALEEDVQPMGSWVTYLCRASKCSFREKVFEDNGKAQMPPKKVTTTTSTKKYSVMQRGIDGQIELLNQMKTFLEGLSEQFDEINKRKQQFLNSLDSEGLDLKLLQRFEEYFAENKQKTRDLISKIEGEDIPYTEQVIRYLEDTPR
jgi:hypothetical protein